MKKPILQTSILMCVLVFEGMGHLVFAQQPVASSPASQPKLEKVLSPLSQEQLLQATAIQTLVSVADAARKWDDVTAAAIIEAKIADLIWEENADTGRGYLVKAWEMAGRIEESKGELSPFRNESSQTRARQQVLLVARKRASSLATKWLDEMAAESAQNKDTANRGVFDDRSSRSTVLLQMAKAALADNPQTAAELATASLNDGISFGLQEVLIALQDKDLQLALNVFRAALARLRTRGMSDPNELLVLYAYLYTPGRISSANTSSNPGSRQIAVGRDQTRIIAAAELNPALALEFLGLAADLLISAPPPPTTANPEATARSQISVINVIMGKELERLPETAAALQLKAQQIGSDAKFTTLPESGRSDRPEPRAEESSKDYAQRRIDALEEAAEKAPDDLSRNIAYARAGLATDVDHYQRGLDLASKISDDSLRADVKNWILYRAALQFVKSSDLARVYELNAKNTDLLQRAATLVVGAQKFIETNDQTTARTWLDEARALIKKGHNADENAPRIALGIVTSYARVDKWTALETLSEAVKFMNEFPRAAYDDERAPLVRRFSGFGVVPNFTYGTTGFSLEAALRAFPADQFDSAFYRLHEISSPEARGLALVTLCRKYLHAAKDSPKSPARKPS